MREIGPGIYVETGYEPVTVGAILTGDGWICVDAPLHVQDVHDWLAALQSVSAAPVRYVVATDYHRDRAVGSAWFKEPLIAHQVTAARLAALGSSYILQAAEELSVDDNELVQLASLRPVLPQITFSDGLYLHFGGRQIELVSKPSATLGSVWVVLRDEKIVFTGDSVLVGQHPHISDGASKAWLDALRLLRLERHADWKVVPGRGEVCSPAGTAPLSEYLRVARRRIASLLYAHRQRAEVAQLLPEFLAFFRYEASLHDQVQRRVRAGLEAIYDEMRALGETGAEAEDA
jgi:glyoxylase-like metal-dependent hydrolase (beta-lactamase superfamily II)